MKLAEFDSSPTQNEPEPTEAEARAEAAARPDAARRARSPLRCKCRRARFARAATSGRLEHQSRAARCQCCYPIELFALVECARCEMNFHFRKRGAIFNSRRRVKSTSECRCACSRIIIIISAVCVRLGSRSGFRLPLAGRLRLEGSLVANWKRRPSAAHVSRFWRSIFGLFKCFASASVRIHLGPRGARRKRRRIVQ